MTDTPPPDGMRPELVAGVRSAMYEFVNGAGSRRVLPTVFHVGTPGGRPGWARQSIAEDTRLERGMRADLVERALDGLESAHPCGWVTRSGPLAPTDPDFAWLAATLEAFARHGWELPAFFVITRSGWMDLMAEEPDPQPGVRRRRRRRA